MSKEHAYAYEAGYRDGSIHYELEHCPACKNVADLQEALEENAKLRDELDQWHRLTAGIELPEYPITEFKPKDLERENAWLRELVRGLHMAHVGMVHRYKGSETATIWEWSNDPEYDMKRLESECEEECHRFDVAMRELGIEVSE